MKISHGKARIQSVVENCKNSNKFLGVSKHFFHDVEDRNFTTFSSFYHFIELGTLGLNDKMLIFLEFFNVF